MSTMYRVGGMTCDGCANAVARAVMSRVPAARVLVDLKAATVAVEGDASEAQVRDAIEDAGYDFGGRAG
ncbi:MAG TPA: heavy metal-associated domain-containing protein [Alphaproteobacteria bacterium]|nr:heavy metal-associated domain-containing protein [Alphaproteobacteria bacterium]